MKNVDLIREFGDASGIWHAIKDGIGVLDIKEGKLRVKLKE